MAARLATRALAWGTAVTAVGAALGVVAVRLSGVRTVGQFGTKVHDVLDPVEAWLQTRGEWMQAQMGRLHDLGTWAGEALDGPRRWLAFRVTPKPSGPAPSAHADADAPPHAPHEGEARAAGPESVTLPSPDASVAPAATADRHAASSS